MLVKGGTVGNGEKKLWLTTKPEMWESSEQSQNNSVESLEISSKEKLPNTASPLTDRIHPTNYAHGFGFNTLRPTQNRNHFADDIFKGIFFNENVWIPIRISLKFVPLGPINNILALVQIMAWGHPGNEPLSEPTIISLPMHIWITRP